MKTAMEILYDYIVKMENNYINMAKESKDKDFKQRVDAILTATTLIRVQMEDGVELEKEQIMKTARQCHFEGVRQSAKTSEEYIAYAEQYYNETFDSN